MEMQVDRSKVYRVIILFGLVSFLGDIIYEGARGVIPSYLAYLGASAFLVGLVSGISEFIALTLRLIAGILTDVTRSYWKFYVLGYALIISIPLIGLSNMLPIVITLIVLERVAKAIRTPARDSLISFISRGVGAGKAFGIHEALDQFGAILGPLSMGVILLITTNDYSMAFLVTFIPYLALLASVTYAYRSYPPVTPVREADSRAGIMVYDRRFWLYNVSVLLNTVALIHVSLIILASSRTFDPAVAAFLYTLIQGVDMFSALLAGAMFDRFGRIFLCLPFTLSILPSILALLGGGANLILASVFYGIVLGMQESIYRAAISTMVTEKQRGSAYGIFNTFYGVGSLVSATVFGYFIEMGFVRLGILFTLIGQIAALITLILSVRSKI
ncbi:MAG: MFS transporter [Candidatus Korarchaeum sp.]